MAIVQVDLTKPTVLPDGRYTLTFVKTEIYMPQAGATTATGNPKAPSIIWTLHEPQTGLSVRHFTSFNAPFLIKPICEACNVKYDANGFDTDDCLNHQIEADVVVVDDPKYGPQNKITKVYKI